MRQNKPSVAQYYYLNHVEPVLLMQSCIELLVQGNPISRVGMDQNGGYPLRIGSLKHVFRALTHHINLVSQQGLQGQGAADGGVAQVGVQVAELLHLSLFGPGKPEHDDRGPGGGRWWRPVIFGFCGPDQGLGGTHTSMQDSAGRTEAWFQNPLA